MKLKLLLTCLLGISLTAMTTTDEPKEILLWPKGAPGSEGKNAPEKKRITPEGDIVISSVHKPSITPYLPAAGKSTGVAVLVIPGGGHSEIWISHEGYSPARWLQEHGIAAFVLKYRLARDTGSTYTVDKDELADVQRALRLIRHNAAEWHIDTAKVGAIGFSAGGELVALAGMHYSASDASASDMIDRENNKPDFQGLIYPGNSRRYTVGAATPPAFIAAGYKDRPDISEGSAQLYIKYKEAKIPAELHIYGNIGHGFGIRKTNTGAETLWPEEFRAWLKDMGFLK